MLRSNFRLLLLLVVLFVIVAPSAVFADPNLKVTITHNGNASAGNADFLAGSSTGTVTIVVENGGADPSAGLIDLTVTLGGGLTFNTLVSSTPGNLFTCSNVPTPVTCVTNGLTSIAAGATETVTFRVNAPVTTGGPFTNNASISGGGSISNADDDDVPFNVVTAAVELTIVSLTHAGNGPNNDFVINSNSGQVTVAITHQGTIPSFGVSTLVVNLGGGLTFRTQATGALYSCSGGATGNPVTCTTGAVIQPGTGDSVTFSVNVPGTPLNNQTNTAVLSGGGDTTPSNAADNFNIVGAPTATLTPTA
ncbi:MAG: hypothetical protein ABI835_06185, partial [Chloroflexota bacterium]